jgi:hypothetical protein
MVDANPHWAKRHGQTVASATVDSTKWLNEVWGSLQHDFPIDGDPLGAVGKLAKLVSSPVSRFVPRHPSTKDLKARIKELRLSFRQAWYIKRREAAAVRAALKDLSDSLKAPIQPSPDLVAWRAYWRPLIETATKDLTWTFDPVVAREGESSPVPLVSLKDDLAAFWDGAALGTIAELTAAVNKAAQRAERLEKNVNLEHRQNRRFAAEFDRKLDARKRAKNGEAGPASSHGAKPAAPGLLRVTTTSQTLSGGIAAKARLPRKLLPDPVSAAGAEASFENDYLHKKVRLRFQAGGQDVNHRSVGKVVLTQDTVVTQNVYTGRFGISASSHDSSSPTDETRKAEASGDWKYGTLSYRSVSAYWIDSIGEPTEVQALPNGSGVSFGVSIEPGRLGRYAHDCANLAQGDSPSDSALEELFLKQLRLNAAEARAFFANYPYAEDTDSKKKHLQESDFNFERSMIVETGFDFYQKESIPFLQRSGQGILEPGSLFDISAAKSRLAGKADDAMANLRSRLSVIRVRYPIGADEDTSSSLFSFGWTFATKDDTSASSLTDPAGSAEGQLDSLTSFVKDGEKATVTATPSVGITRIRRTGSEGFFDVHTEFFPKLIKDFSKEATGQRGIKPDQRQVTRPIALDHEYAVPPVALFGHGQ